MLPEYTQVYSLSLNLRIPRNYSRERTVWNAEGRLQDGLRSNPKSNKVLEEELGSILKANLDYLGPCHPPGTDQQSVRKRLARSADIPGGIPTRSGFRVNCCLQPGK